MSEVYRKIRNTFRYLLGNLEDYSSFDPESVPAESLHEIDRWALGQLNHGKDNKELREALFERIADVLSIPPEDYLVRFACILALGEMGFTDSLPTLRQFSERIPFPIGYACEWATKHIEKTNPK